MKKSAILYNQIALADNISTVVGFGQIIYEKSVPIPGSFSRTNYWNGEEEEISLSAPVDGGSRYEAIVHVYPTDAYSFNQYFILDAANEDTLSYSANIVKIDAF